MYISHFVFVILYYFSEGRSCPWIFHLGLYTFELHFCLLPILIYFSGSVSIFIDIKMTFDWILAIADGFYITITEQANNGWALYMKFWFCRYRILFWVPLGVGQKSLFPFFCLPKFLHDSQLSLLGIWWHKSLIQSKVVSADHGFCIFLPLAPLHLPSLDHSSAFYPPCTLC